MWAGEKGGEEKDRKRWLGGWVPVMQVRMGGGAIARSQRRNFSGGPQYRLDAWRSNRPPLRSYKYSAVTDTAAGS
jgi:hypothetical protein